MTNLNSIGITPSGGFKKSLHIKELIRRDIRCFQHNCQSKNISLCLEIPQTCSTCKKDLRSTRTSFKIPPFFLPKPQIVSNLINIPSFCIILQLIDENLEDGNLHIGITNSKSDIYDFNSNGMNRNSSSWLHNASITIRLDRIGNKNKLLQQFLGVKLDSKKWDCLLDDYFQKSTSQWTTLSYHETNMNCLDFIVDFLSSYGSVSIGQANKRDALKKMLLNELIEPEFCKFLKFVNLVKELNEKKVLSEKFENFSNQF
jgi:hypothetical protein